LEEKNNGLNPTKNELFYNQVGSIQLTARKKKFPFSNLLLLLKRVKARNNNKPISVIVIFPELFLDIAQGELKRICSGEDYPTLL
jgi:hypothetical protein